MSEFRFEELEIWKTACDVGSDLCDIANQLEEKRLYRFAEQLRGAAISISNNIAEGSGSSSNPESGPKRVSPRKYTKNLTGGSKGGNAAGIDISWR